MHRALATLLTLLPYALAAQDLSLLTAEEAVALARRSGPLAGVAAATRQVIAGRARADAAWPNPIAEWRYENIGSDLAPDVFATLQVPFDLTGRRAALRSAARIASLRGRADSAAAARALEHDVLRAYWRAGLAAELAAIADSERVAREQTAVYDGQRFREGAIAEVVAMRGRLEADRARVAAAGARAEAMRARVDLARLLGRSPDAIPPLAPIAPPALAAVAASDTAWDAVRTRRPDLAAVRYTNDELQRRATAESRGLIGDVNVVGGYKGTAGIATGVIGVLLPLPLFNRNEGARERSTGEFQLARAGALEAEWRARGEVVAAARAWDEAMQAGRDGAATLDDRASEVARIAEAAYREGATSFLELLEAQRARAEARATAVRWAVDARLAWLDLARATGLPLLSTRP